MQWHCLSLSDGDRTDALKFRPMVEDNNSRNKTAYTISIEARDGVTTGVSAADRFTTIKTDVHLLRVSTQRLKGLMRKPQSSGRDSHE